MAEFINLDHDNSLLNITEDSKLLKKKKEIVELPEDDIPQFKYVPKKESELLFDIEIPQVEYIPKQDSEEEEFLLQSSCGIEQYYGDASKEDYFRRENLFSELVNEYQRSKARYNLGIGEEYSLIWGNVGGLINNQGDLVDYIHNTFGDFTNDYIVSINKLLLDWGLEINYNLNQKVDKYSPHLEGIPTTTLPSIDDDSARIASTEWVNSKLRANEDYNIKFISLNKTHMFYGDPPQNIILTWEFYNLPDELMINETPININSTSYTFSNINNNLTIRFSYKRNDKWYNKILNFEKVYAYYYGLESEVSSMSKTKDSSIIVNSLPNKFVYLYLPNDGKARLFVDNILGGFKTVSATIINGISYYLYRTVNSGLGELYIKYDKQ